MTKKKIIVLDDTPLIPTLIQEFLAENEEFEVTKIIMDKDEFISTFSNDAHDIALIDISIGGREGGLDVLRMLKIRQSKLPTMIVSAHEEADYALKGLILGARGYLNKRYICTDLVTALQKISSGDLYISGPHGNQIIDKYKSSYEAHLKRPLSKV